MADDIVQVIQDAREDAVSLSQFIYYPASTMVERRLAPSIHTLNYYLDYLHGLELIYSQPTGTVIVNGEEIKTVRQAINDSVDSVILGDYQTTLETGLAQEVIRATNRENDIEDALDTEVIRATDAEGVISQDLSDLNLEVDAQKLDTGITATAKFGGVERTQADKNADIISVKDFGAVGDYTTNDTFKIQNTISSGHAVIHIRAGNYRITSPLVVLTAGQKIILDSGATITLDTTTADLVAFDVQGKGASVEGGNITTTLRTLGFLVNLAGENTLLKNSNVFFETKSVIAPIGGVNIPYNRGGVSARGRGSRVINNDIYNQEGSGVTTYGHAVVLKGNRIHDNVLGVNATGLVTERNLVSVIDNDIFDNNVNHASGADGILSSQYTDMIIANNRITGNGEHGTYLYSLKSVITGNYVSGNYETGIKVRSIKDTLVNGNTVVDNQTKGGIGDEITLQPAKGNTSDPTMINIIVSNNIATNTSDLVNGIKTNWLDIDVVVKNISVSNNIANSIALAFNNDITVANNIVKGDLIIGASYPTAPAEQFGALVVGNRAKVIHADRCKKSTFSDNVCDSMTIKDVLSDNSYTNNTMLKQATSIPRANFDRFMFNTVDCTLLTGDILKQASIKIWNDNKQIIGNRYLNTKSRVINDSSASISGNKNIISLNMVSGTSDLVSMWGTGHSIVGNVNIGTGLTGYVGISNSWAIGNNPITTYRAEGTGNTTL